MKADKSWGIEYFHRMLKIECLQKGEGSHSNGAQYTERLRNLPKIRQQFNCCLNFKFRALSSGVIFKGSSHSPSRGRITKKETQSPCAEVKPRRGEGSPNSLLCVLGWVLEENHTLTVYPTESECSVNEKTWDYLQHRWISVTIQRMYIILRWSWWNPV